MNAKSFTKFAAVFSMAVGMNAQSWELGGKVPVDFQISGKQLSAGNYSMLPQGSGPGIVSVRDAAGNRVAISMFTIQTEGPGTNKNLLLLTRTSAHTSDAASYQLTGYCRAGSGCWSSRDGVKKPGSGQVQIALRSSR